MIEIQEYFIVELQDQGKRLDLFLAQKTSCSRSLIQKGLKKKQILVNSSPKKTSYLLKPKDKISFLLKKEEPHLSFQPENINLNIVYEDSDILVINKPSNLVVHPANGNTSGTLLNALLNYYPPIKSAGGQERCGIVHRLDKDTTGLMVVAKNNEAFDILTQDFKERKIEKKYIALAYGTMKTNAGIIEIGIGRDIKNRKKISPRSNKLRAAKTSFVVKKYFPEKDISLLELTLETGRTHQIRVHLKAIKNPIAGDKLYGKKKNKMPFKRQMLHAFKLCFNHPLTQEYLTFEIDMPDDFKKAFLFLEG